jgi:hypothetical protein
MAVDWMLLRDMPSSMSYRSIFTKLDSDPYAALSEVIAKVLAVRASLPTVAVDPVVAKGTGQ